ncbi:MAG: sensor histidine kinase [Rhizomicrobium sp.]
MAQSRAAIGATGSLTSAVRWPVRQMTRNIRFTVIFSVVLICGSFAAAAAIQMRNDRSHALAEAASFDEQRAREISVDLTAALARYVSLGSAFADASTTAETSAALSEAGGAALRNIAVLDIRGELQSELTSSPKGFLPLSPETLDAARDGHAVAASRDGKSFAIIFGAGPHIVAVQLDAKALMPSASEEEALLTTLSGQVVALGAQWRALPAMDTLALGDRDHASGVIDMPDGNRLIALCRVADWPLAVGASSRVGAALDAWYGALPLYFFFIFGPAFAGAGLAVVFVREFERRARTAEAMRNLRATRPGEARLLVRLADAERRVIEAERSRREFLSHMSHELRTPLNAIIGFSEVIERGVFGAHVKYGEYARDIGAAGRELHDRIGDILDFVDLEARRRPLETAQVDLVPILRRLVDENAAKAHARGIRLAVTLPVTAAVLTDTLGVRRILGNLLANALQYSTPGSTVRVQARNTDDAVYVGVQDQGLGFTPEELEKLGEPFRRFDRTGATTGTGLGIAIAMLLARRIGAVIRIAGKQGVGTIAELRLPKA